MGATEPYQIVIFKDLMVPVRDGVCLATDIYRPARRGELSPGPFPALLVRTSYDKQAEWLIDEVAHFFTPRGYVLVLQDLRGRHRSEGMGQYFHTANETAGTDGFDTVEWIAAQPWSNGRVGAMGSSHLALVQTHMALYRPPHLKAIWPDVGPTNSYAHQVRWGGAMQLHMFGALFLHAHDAQEIQHDPEARRGVFEAMERMGEWVCRTPFQPGQTPLAVVPNLEKTLFDYYRRGAYDEFWRLESNDFEQHFERHADVPGTYSGGWYDPFAIATTRYFAAMARQNRTLQRLIMGPWTHGGMRSGSSLAGDVDFGAESVWGRDHYNRERLSWFERWLKDRPLSPDPNPPVRLFVMGGGSGRKTAGGKLNHGGAWRWEGGWPLARTRYTRYYLRSGGSLSPERPAIGDPPARCTFDPSRPVPTIAGAMTSIFELAPLGELADTPWSQFIPARARMRSLITEGAADQRERPGLLGCRLPFPRLSARPDVLVFQTPPLKKDVELTGDITAKLWISSTALDTDITAKLLDVYPPNEDYPEGYDVNLVDGILRVRYRNGFEKEELMRRGEIYAIEITLPPTSNLFKAGHRIRVDISSSNFPRFDVNPNTGEPMGRHTHSLVAHNTVYLDGDRPSHLILPIIPGKRGQ